MGVNFTNFSLEQQTASYGNVGSYLQLTGNPYYYAACMSATTPIDAVTGSTNITNAGVLRWNYRYTVTEGTYNTSNGYWTAASDGFYYTWCKWMGQPTYDNKYLQIQKNGSSSWMLRIYSSAGGNMYHMATGGTCFYMNAGDYLYVYNANAQIYGGSDYCGWIVAKVG